MTHYRYTLTPKADVSAGRTGEVQQTRAIHRVLPGSAVRGALGHTWWHSPTQAFDRDASHRARQDAFDRLFGRALVVRDAVPAGVSRFDPASLLTLKYKGQGSHDRVRYDLARGPLTACPSCGAPWGMRGWFDTLGRGLAADRCQGCDASFQLAKNGWFVDDLVERTTTRTKLVNGVADDGMLFIRPSLTKSVAFNGSLTVREHVSVPAEALAWLEQVLAFNVGGQRSTLGRVEWRTETTPAPAIPKGNRVVLQLRSPALLIDGLGFPTTDLAAALRADSRSRRLACRPWLRTTTVSGWHAVAGVPKPVEWAVAAGATAVLEGWSPEALLSVASGIGLRQLEGYGEVVLKHPEELDNECGNDPSENHPREHDPVIDCWVGSLAPERRSRVVNQMLDAAREIDTLRRRGAREEELDHVIERRLKEPWAQRLGPDSRIFLEKTLRSPAQELTEHIVRLNAARGAQ